MTTLSLKDIQPVAQRIIRLTNGKSQEPDATENDANTLRLSVIIADITQLNVGAIVNAANSSLLGGGGVDGAIHRAAGRELLEYCRGLNGCQTGDAKISPGFNLPADYVLHTVGPVWHGGNNSESELLANCYRNSLTLALHHHIKSIAFPAISTGVYGYPIEEATQIAIKTVQQFIATQLNENLPLSITDIVFCCFSSADAAVYKAILDSSPI